MCVCVCVCVRARARAQACMFKLTTTWTTILPIQFRSAAAAEIYIPLLTTPPATAVTADGGGDG